MIFILDTNVLLHFLRGKRAYYVENFSINDPNARLLISAVSIGELRALSLRNKWGTRKTLEMEVLINKLFVVEINNDAIHNCYAEIDTFSQGKLDERPLGTSARNMGKNDLWIAATASVFNATLLTTDNDFDHLNAIFVDVPKIDLVKLAQY
jgi:tRNA(fMet)-specific endonuclease VapC